MYITSKKLRLSVLLFAVVAICIPALGQGPRDFHPRPVPMGISTSTTPSSPFIFAGTMGMRVKWFAAPNILGILSNNHVYGAVGPDLCPNTATPGSTFVLQPGTLDIGSDPGEDPNFIVGKLAGFVPIDFSGGNNLVDAAVAFTNTSLTKTEILGIGEPNTTLDAGVIALPGMAVTKSGRTTGTTNGTVAEVNATVNVSYGGTCGVARFVNQVVVVPGTFSDPGDSGAAILRTDTKQPVALLFAGSTSETIGNQMVFVYQNLGFVVDGPAPVGDAQAKLQTLAANMYADARIKALAQTQAREEANIFKLQGVNGMSIGRAANGGFGFVIYAEKVTPALRQAVRRRLGSTPVQFKQRPRFRAF